MVVVVVAVVMVDVAVVVVADVVVVVGVGVGVVFVVVVVDVAAAVMVGCSHKNSRYQVRGHRTGFSHSGVEEYPRKKIKQTTHGTRILVYHTSS